VELRLTLIQSLSRNKTGDLFMRMRSKSEFVHRLICFLSFFGVIFAFVWATAEGADIDELPLVFFLALFFGALPILTSWLIFWLRDSKVRLRSESKRINRLVDVLTVLVMLLFGLFGGLSFSEWLGANVVIAGGTNIFMVVLYFLVDGYRLDNVK
jgi:hypothetical protein